MSGKPPEIDSAVVESNLTPLDFAIFAHLPDQGATLGYHELFLTIKALTAELNKTVPSDAPKLKTSEVSSRVRVLRAGGLTHAVLSLSGTVVGWQRTARARQLLEARNQTRSQEAESNGAAS
jgi:hypothetical protein